MRLLDSEGGAPPYEPDIEIMDFLGNQLRVMVGIAPWLLAIALAVGLLFYALRHLNLR